MGGANAHNKVVLYRLSHLVLLGGVGACLPFVLVLLLSWTTVLLVDNRPWGPAVKTSGWCCCCCNDEFFDAPLPNVDNIVGVLAASSMTSTFFDAPDDDDPVRCFLFGS